MIDVWAIVAANESIGGPEKTNIGEEKIYYH
jgi:hypothetical protein